MLLFWQILLFSLVTATEKCLRKRKISEADTSVETDYSGPPTGSSSGHTDLTFSRSFDDDASTTLSLSQVIRQGTEIFASRPVSEWTVLERFDIDVFFETEEERRLLPLYRTLFEQILKRNFRYVNEAIGLFDFTKWFYNRVSGRLMTYFHLLFIRFPLEQFSRLMPHFDERMLLILDSAGHNCMYYAERAHDQEKCDYLKPILSAHNEEIQALARNFC